MLINTLFTFYKLFWKNFRQQKIPYTNASPKLILISWITNFDLCQISTEDSKNAVHQMHPIWGDDFRILSSHPGHSCSKFIALDNPKN